MNPIAMFFGLILLAVSVFFVASPLRSSVVAKKSTARSLKLSPEKQRQATLFALRDLDFDYQAGKVAEEDYQSLRVSLVNEAAELLQAQDRQKEDSIEALIQSRRLTHNASQLVMNTNRSAKTHCQHCQAPLADGVKFCSKCGTPVQSTACPKCSQPTQADDRFCPSCGTAIPEKK